MFCLSIKSSLSLGLQQKKCWDFGSFKTITAARAFCTLLLLATRGTAHYQHGSIYFLDVLRALGIHPTAHERLGIACLKSNMFGPVWTTHAEQLHNISAIA